MTEQKSFMEAMNYRFATKEFDTSKKIKEEDLKQILEVGRLSPSSYGLEHWKFVVIKNQELKEKVQEVSYNQKQVGTASEVIVYLTKKKDLRANSEYIKKVFTSRMPQEVVDTLLTITSGHISSFSEERFDEWCKKQNYIAAANMMTYAASIGIDSCPMEGFDESGILKVLNLNSEEYGVALVIPFGFRVNEPKRVKTRLPFEEVVEFRE